MDKQSGISVSVPTVISYPDILKFSDVRELRDQFVYVVDEYPLTGLSVVAARVQTDKGMQINWKFGDWDGNEINVMGKDHNAHWSNKFLTEYSPKVLQIMQLIKLFQAQFYFSIVNQELCLVDIRLSLNKFTGPGMVKDIFGKVVRTQEEIGDPIRLDDDNINRLVKRQKPYNTGNGLIIKPSAFKTIVRNKALMPMYAIIK